MPGKDYAGGADIGGKVTGQVSADPLRTNISAADHEADGRAHEEARDRRSRRR